MKFTKEQAFENLKRELTNNGKKTLRMSERTLNSILETLIEKFADDEIGLPDFTVEALKVLNPVNDNIGKDKSDYVKEWKKEHPDQPEDVNPETKPQTSNPELDALKAEIEALKKVNAEANKQKTIAQKRSDAIAKLKEKGVKDEEWMNDFLSEVNIHEDLDVDSKVESWLKIYNKSHARVGGAPAPDNPSGGGTAADKYKETIKTAGQGAKRERANIESKI